MVVVGLLLSSLPSCMGQTKGLIRVTTEPSGARFFLPRLGLEGTTPFEFAGVRLGDTIVLTHEGYFPWEQSISELPKVREGSYRLIMKPRR
jgi:hypothetical protein